MASFNWVDETSTHIFGANQYGIIVYDKGDESIDDLTKVDALSETNISAFVCHPTENICMIGYDNGNLDFIAQGKEITNQPAIQSSNIIGDKAIEHVVFDGTNALILSGIGLVRLDLSTFNVLEFSRFSFNGEFLTPRNMVFNDGWLIISAETGIYRIREDRLFIDEETEQMNYSRNPSDVSEFTELNSELYALQQSIDDGGDTLHLLVGNEFIPSSILEGEELRHLEQRDDAILVTGRDQITNYSTSFEETSRIYTYSTDRGVDARYARFAQDGTSILIADGFNGIVKSSFENQFNPTVISVSSPQSGVISVVEEAGGNMYAMPGGSEFTFNFPYLHQFSDQEWSSTILVPEGAFGINNTIDIEENEDLKYVAFDRSGLMILDQNNSIIQHFDEENNQIEDEKDGYYGITGLELDEEGNLWMLNSRTENTLSVLTPNGDWGVIDIPGYVKPIVSNLNLLSNGMLVFALKEAGIVVYDPNGTALNTADDRFVNINASPTQGNLPSSTVYSIVEDNDGEIWLGTGEGVGVIYSIENVFEEGFRVDQIIVNQDGFNGYLFETDAVISMAIDGANRKWVAPSGAGLFLISPDGQTQLAHFTEEESPLLDNNITDLAILQETGEVFIATESGLQSYRSDASKPSESLGDITIFPNPVKPNYNGNITFNGLTEESYLRVTDASGNLIFETASQGGTAIWDGNTLNGDRVRSGVYLIYAADRNGSNGSVAKLMILN